MLHYFFFFFPLFVAILFLVFGHFLTDVTNDNSLLYGLSFMIHDSDSQYLSNIIFTISAKMRNETSSNGTRKHESLGHLDILSASKHQITESKE